MDVLGGGFPKKWFQGTPNGRFGVGDSLKNGFKGPQMDVLGGGFPKKMVSRGPKWTLGGGIP